MPSNAQIPSEAMSSNAQNRVLTTPDILVCILSLLPHSSLLQAKLVNKTWASLFDHVDIQAAMFERPRPKGSALCSTETYSDVLKEKFSAFWPHGDGRREEPDAVEIPKGYFKAKVQQKEKGEGAVDGPKPDCPSGTPLQETGALQQWRQLLVCQPAVEVLEIVQYVDRRGSHPIEFRTVIPRPNGLRMGFLYDAVRHWYEVERSFEVKVLWNRKTGDLIRHYDAYDGDDDDDDDDGGGGDGPGYKTAEDKPCVTIWGRTSVGCGQWGGLTYEKYCAGGNMRGQVIKSGDEKVKYSMSGPKAIGVDWNLFGAYLKRNWEDDDDEEEEEPEEEEEDPQDELESFQRMRRNRFRKLGDSESP